jgi:hypothetical protein
MKKLLLALGSMAAVGAVLAITTDPSDWRYPKMLISELPKMPFRYFV